MIRLGLSEHLCRIFPFSEQRNDWLTSLSDFELPLVKAMSATARSPGSRKVAIVISRSGDWWIYPIIAIAAVLYARTAALFPLLTALLSVGLLHCVYPPLKNLIGRVRPYEFAPGLTPLAPALDRYSFPSGHIMTLTGALVPLVRSLPESTWLLVTLWLALAWSRLATSLHFPTDVLAGAILGGTVAYTISICLN